MYKTPLAYNREKTAEIVPSMRWDGKENFGAWQDRGRSELTRLLGLPFKKCDAKFRVEYEKDQGDFIETRFDFQSEEGFFVPCHFLAPKNVSGKRPLVLCLMGHGTGMHINLGRKKYPQDEEALKLVDRAIAIRAVKEGYCALLKEQRCFGELGGTEKGPDCTVSSMAALLIGRTTIGERVWDLQRVLDLALENFPVIDKDKIICTGNSGGGTITFFASCLESRISYSMPSCYFCSFDDCIGAMHHCACNFIPNIRLFFDMGDLAGLIAPRPLVIIAGRKDEIFPLPGVEKAFKEAQRMYSGAGASDKIKLTVGEEGHRYYADLAWEAMNPFVR